MFSLVKLKLYTKFKKVTNREIKSISVFMQVKMDRLKMRFKCKLMITLTKQKNHRVYTGKLKKTMVKLSMNKLWQQLKSMNNQL